jgi:hypothetical protein
MKVRVQNYEVRIMKSELRIQKLENARGKQEVRSQILEIMAKITIRAIITAMMAP